MVKIAAEEGIVNNRYGFRKMNNLCRRKITALKLCCCELCSANKSEGNKADSIFCGAVLRCVGRIRVLCH